MTKRIITLVFVVVLILNTFYWLNLIAQLTPELKPLPLQSEEGRIDWDRIVAEKKLGRKETSEESWERLQREIRYTFNERLAISLGDWKLSKGLITLLVITDSVLVIIPLMIIPLYKKE